jgi:hypothetical protein
MPGLPTTLNPRPASDLTLCPVRGRGTLGQAVKTNLVSPGWYRQDQTVIERLVSG